MRGNLKNMFLEKLGRGLMLTSFFYIIVRFDLFSNISTILTLALVLDLSLLPQEENAYPGEVKDSCDDWLP